MTNELANIESVKRNCVGTVDITMSIQGMRKTQEFTTYPVPAGDTSGLITIQSETRIGKLDINKARGLMSKNHSGGACHYHLGVDSLTKFYISEEDKAKLIEKLLAPVFKGNLVSSDNSSIKNLIGV